jgi:cell division protease FtsH
MLTCSLVFAVAGALLTVAAFMLWRRFFRHDAAPENSIPTGLTDWDRRTMAYHEAGHAVCSYYLPEREPLLRVSIAPDDEAFGMVRTAVRSHHNETRVSFASTLAVLLAGRLSEELFLHEVTTSCVHDLAAARQLASNMVTQLGMGSRCALTLPPPELAVGEALMKQRDADIQELLADATRSGRNTLFEHRAEVVALAELLLVRDTLDRRELEDFFRNLVGE